MTPAYDVYSDFPAEYSAYVTRREQSGPDTDPFGLLPPMLDLLEDITGRRVLDAGCGEGYLARVLAARGAQVTAIDLSPRLIELARARDSEGSIDYQAIDLSRPQPALAGSFDAAASYLVLNDIADYQGFAATLGTALKPGGRLVLAFNNPYSSVVDRHATDYFDSGAVTPYRGLWQVGVKAYYHHRTLENYLDAFGAVGLQLTKLHDVPALADAHKPDAFLPEGGRFPRFMILAFTKS